MAESKRKVRVGEVVSNRMDKTVIVAVRWQQRHRLYRKGIRRITRFYAHDEANQCRLGDSVRIVETRPLSLMKRWRVAEILQRREVPEIKPVELDQGVLELAPADSVEEAESQGLDEEEASGGDEVGGEAEVGDDDAATPEEARA